jgi:molybdopterin molybdotransferase
MAISIDDAIVLIHNTIQPTKSEFIPIELALDRVIAQDVEATLNLPIFDNSAMDGFATTLATAGQKTAIASTIFAGDKNDYTLEANQTYKIMTGAKLPTNTEVIVPVEDTTIEGDFVTFPSNLKSQNHMRFMGEDIAQGEKLIDKGTKLSAYHLTVLASQGVSHIHVYKRPRVAVFATGEELKLHYEQLEPGQLYNSNSPMLYFRAKTLGCDVTFVGSAKDNLEDIKAHIESALDSDFIITSGGVSVGDADFTKEAFDAFGFETLFSKVDIKPGKPTTFGKIGSTYILNLPGNPLAALMNFELFATTAIFALAGFNKPFFQTITTSMENELKIKPGKYTVTPGVFNGENFSPAPKRAPGMLSPLLTSNAIMITNPEISHLTKESLVKIIYLEQSLRRQDFQSCIN